MKTDMEKLGWGDLEACTLMDGRMSGSGRVVSFGFGFRSPSSRHSARSKVASAGSNHYDQKDWSLLIFWLKSWLCAPEP